VKVDVHIDDFPLVWRIRRLVNIDIPFPNKRWKVIRAFICCILYKI